MDGSGLDMESPGVLRHRVNIRYTDDSDMSRPRLSELPGQNVHQNQDQLSSEVLVSHQPSLLARIPTRHFKNRHYLKSYLGESTDNVTH